MKEKLLDFTFCLICFITLIFIFINNKEVAIIINKACILFFKTVFPSLFPMFILNDLLIFANVPYYFCKTFSKYFKINGLSIYIFIMCLISGTPSQSYILKNLCNENKITTKEANHFLYFTYFANPLFLFSILNSLFPLNITIKIILIHYSSNIIIALLTKKETPLNNITITRNTNTLGHTLINSINKSINTLLMILGTIIFYMLICYIITNIIPTNNLLKTLIAGFLEITNGLNMLKDLNIILKLKEIIALLIISFGGLSIHTQIKALLEDTSIDYKYFLKGRIMQTIISFFLIIIL